MFYGISANPDKDGYQLGSHCSNAILSMALCAARVLVVGILAWFLFVGQGGAQKASDVHAKSAAEQIQPHRAITVADAIGMTRFLGFDKGGPTSQADAALFWPDRSRFLSLFEKG